ncbi:haloacid dehalogenase-like hydrolase domain-containing protein 3 [Crotalus tigris]|uniref:haloacid dehalogenase-like hydrolase domain-containing protein 3 n=1 Tax=Crotalus tigris TaxID=88082 RepID=UPI00192F8339|nr:haloacid dehalogenase-like hydrolase domain-containing protein 3 [Crotalus tigris]
MKREDIFVFPPVFANGLFAQARVGRAALSGGTSSCVRRFPPEGGSSPRAKQAAVMLRLRLLTWDVTNTLLHLRVPVGQSYSAEAQAFGLQVPAEVLNHSFSQAHASQSQRFPNYGWGQGLSSKQWWLGVVFETFRLAGIHDSGVLWPIAEKLYRDYSSPKNWELIPGAIEILQWCQQRGIRMAVVSNSDWRVQEILSRCNLRQYFQFVLTSEEVGFAKPDRRIFLEALHSAKVEPQLAAHIGDHYVNDYLAARKTGLHSFLFKMAGEPIESDIEVPENHLLSSLLDLQARIEKG